MQVNQTSYVNQIHALQSTLVRVFIAIIVSSLAPMSANGEQPIPNRLVSLIQCSNNIARGSTITSDSLKTVRVAQKDRPPDAIYDRWIAIGRKATKPLTKGQVMHFSDALSPDLLEASNRNCILKMQGDCSTRTEDSNRSTSVLISVLRSAHNIPAGATISAADLVTAKIKEKNCPGDAVGDLWVVVGRKAVHSIKAHEYVIYLDTIPTAEWLQWLNKGWNGSKKCD